MLSPLRHAVRRSLLSFPSRTLSTLPSEPSSSSSPPPPTTPDDFDFIPPPPLTTGHSPGSPDPAYTRAVLTNPFAHSLNNSFSPPSLSAFPSRRTQPIIMDLPPPADPLMHYLTSALTKDGKRARASGIVSRMLLHVHALSRGAPPLDIVREAIFAAAPSIRIKNNKRAATVVPVPMVMNEKARVRGAVKWILQEVEVGRKGARKGPMRVEERLAREFIKIVQGQSEVLKKKEVLHKHAMVNRGNALSRV